MLGLRRSGKRRRNRNQPRHGPEAHQKERDAKQIDRLLDVANEDSFPGSPTVTIPGARQKEPDDVERPRSGRRGGTQDR
jgi:hypothetical protein